MQNFKFSLQVTDAIFTELILVAQIFTLNSIKIQQTVSLILVMDRQMDTVPTQPSFLTS